MTLKEAKFEDLSGQTLSSITVNDAKDEILLMTTEGATYKLWHEQNCCEVVHLEDVCGDFSDLLWAPLLLAEVVSNEEEPIPTSNYNESDSFRWTFYKLSTVRGSVTLRWLGISNGYYSVEVTFSRVAGNETV